MAKIQSVHYTPAGESLDAGVGEALWSNRKAVERFAEMWAEEASKLIGVDVTVASRPDFANASRLSIELVEPEDDYQAREWVSDMLDRAFEAASDRINDEFPAAA